MATADTTAARAKFAPMFVNTTAATSDDVVWIFACALLTTIGNSFPPLLSSSAVSEAFAAPRSRLPRGLDSAALLSLTGEVSGDVVFSVRSPEAAPTLAIASVVISRR